jgi:hypothetical protein
MADEIKFAEGTDPAQKPQVHHALTLGTEAGKPENIIKIFEQIKGRKITDAERQELMDDIEADDDGV